MGGVGSTVCLMHLCNIESWDSGLSGSSVEEKEVREPLVVSMRAEAKYADEINQGS